MEMKIQIRLREACCLMVLPSGGGDKELVLYICMHYYKLACQVSEPGHVYCSEKGVVKVRGKL